MDSSFFSEQTSFKWNESLGLLTDAFEFDRPRTNLQSNFLPSSPITYDEYVLAKHPHRFDLYLNVH